MAVDLDLAELARASPLIFGGEVRQDAATRQANSLTALVAVNDVIRAPPGLTGFAGSQVTVHLVHALESGRYVFFADLVTVGAGLTLRERGHLDASGPALKRVTAAVLGSHRDLIEGRLDAATLVVLGTLGTVQSLAPAGSRPKGVPWAEVPLQIEKVVKGSAKLRRAVVVGPRHASRHLPAAPALRSGLHALLFLSSPPHAAVEKLSATGRGAAFFIATSSDIQPPDQLEVIERILRDQRKK